MGKRKISNFSLIENQISRNITYCKRKKGLLKKAIEMSLLCGQKVFLAIYDDSKQKLVQYQSSNDFGQKAVMKMCNNPEYKNKYYEFYTDDNYQAVADQVVKTAQDLEWKKSNLPQRDYGDLTRQHSPKGLSNQALLANIKIPPLKQTIFEITEEPQNKRQKLEEPHENLNKQIEHEAPQLRNLQELIFQPGENEVRSIQTSLCSPDSQINDCKPQEATKNAPQINGLTQSFPILSNILLPNPVQSVESITNQLVNFNNMMPNAMVLNEQAPMNNNVNATQQIQFLLDQLMKNKLMPLNIGQGNFMGLPPMSMSVGNVESGVRTPPREQEMPLEDDENLRQTLKSSQTKLNECDDNGGMLRQNNSISNLLSPMTGYREGPEQSNLNKISLLKTQQKFWNHNIVPNIVDKSKEALERNQEQQEFPQLMLLQDQLKLNVSSNEKASLINQWLVNPKSTINNQQQ